MGRLLKGSCSENSISSCKRKIRMEGWAFTSTTVMDNENGESYVRLFGPEGPSARIKIRSLLKRGAARATGAPRHNV